MTGWRTAQVADEGGDVLLGGEGPGGAVPVGAGRGAVPGEVESGAERPSGPGEDHDPARPVPSDGIEGVVEVLDELGGHGVEAFRAVEAEQRHPGGRAGGKHGVRHRLSLARAVRARHGRTAGKVAA